MEYKKEEEREEEKDKIIIFKENEGNISFTNEDNIQKEENLTPENHKLVLLKAKNSMGEISIEGREYGLGFICKIKYDKDEINCLITKNIENGLNPIIHEEEYIKHFKMNIRINGENKAISLDKYRRIWNNKDLNFTCVEILKEDDIFDDLNPFEIDDNCYINYYDVKEYHLRGIVLPSIVKNNNNIELTQGIVYYDISDKNKLFHDCTSKNGFSGCPIILINNLKMIGVNTLLNEKTKKDIGIYFKDIINYIKTNKDMYGKYILDCVFNVNEIKNNVLIFNANENNMKEIGMVLEPFVFVFLNNKRVIIRNKDKKYNAEYNFEKPDKYNIKIIFENNLSNLEHLFEECNELESVDLSNFNMDNIKDISYMFNECHNLKEIKGLNKLNTSKVKYMDAMFQECNELQYLDLSNFNTENVIDMSYMFNKCYKLKEIKGINKLNTNKVTNMTGMFQECYELENLDLSNFRTDNVNDMGWMFTDCYKLKGIKGLNKFNTNNVTKMNSMFQKCNEILYLDLSNFNSDNVTDLSFMFNKCYKLKGIKGIYKFNTNKVTNMCSMFQDCKELQYLDLSNFNTDNVNDMRFMFYNCHKLKNLDVTNFDLNLSCDIGNIFDNVDRRKCTFYANNNHLNELFNS